MTILDAHIHTEHTGPVDGRRLLLEMKQAGVAGGVLLSMSPDSYRRRDAGSPKTRITQVLNASQGLPLLFPFFWIDPIAPDGVRQVDLAVRAGIRGFKVICDRFYPEDRRAIRVYRRIAAAGKPILFHSGILWNGKNSSQYNRPAGFECLLDVPRLRFALAHASWPWTDECLAVYGKFLNARASNPDSTPDMYIDLTPGTPLLYRGELFRKLHDVYPTEDRLLFGTDHLAGNYQAAQARKKIDTDRRLWRKVPASAAVQKSYFSENLLRFIGA